MDPARRRRVPKDRTPEEAAQRRLPEERLMSVLHPLVSRRDVRRRILNMDADSLKFNSLRELSAFGAMRWTTDRGGGRAGRRRPAASWPQAGPRRARRS